MLPNHPLEIKVTYIHKKLFGKGLEQYSVEQLCCIYAEQSDNTLEEFATLYQQTKIFISNLASLRQIVPTEQIEIEEASILKLVNGLIATAALRFYKERGKTPRLTAERDSFISLVEHYAINHLGVAGPSQAPVETNGIIKALSFFWSPVSRIIYGAPTTALSVDPKSPEISPSASS